MYHKIAAIQDFVKKTCDSNLLLLNYKTIYKYLSMFINRNYLQTSGQLQDIKAILNLMASLNKFDASMIKPINQLLSERLSQINRKLKDYQGQNKQIKCLEFLNQCFEPMKACLEKYHENFKSKGAQKDINQINDEYTAIASGLMGLQESQQSQLCLNCLQELDIDLLPRVSQTYLVLGYDENTIQKLFCEDVCGILNNGTGFLLIGSSQNDNDEQGDGFSVKGLDRARLESISKSNNNAQIREFFEQKLRLYFFEHFHHNYSDSFVNPFHKIHDVSKELRKQLNKYLRIRLVPLKQNPETYVIIISLRAKSIHKFYSVRYTHDHKNFENNLIYFISNQETVTPLNDSQLIYQYAQIIQHKIFGKYSQICNSYGICCWCQNQTNLVHICKQCQNCEVFSKLYYLKKNFNKKYLDLKQRIEGKKQYKQSFYPDLRYKNASLLLVNNIKKEKQLIKGVHFHLYMMNFRFVISKPYSKYNSDHFKAIYIISHQQTYKVIRSALEEELTENSYSMINLKKCLSYQLNKKSQQIQKNNKMIGKLEKVINDTFQAGFEKLEGLINKDSQYLTILKFNQITQSILAFVFVQRKVGKALFISEEKYERLKKDILKNNNQMIQNLGSKDLPGLFYPSEQSGINIIDQMITKKQKDLSNH